MAISNCLFSPASENQRGFSVRFVLDWLPPNQATTHSRDRCASFNRFDKSKLIWQKVPIPHQQINFPG